MTNLLGNNLITIYANILPVIWATSNAGLNGLSVYFLRSSSIIFLAPMIATVDLRKNLTKFLMVLLSQMSAYISESGILSTSSDHSPTLSVSYDRNPLIRICTTLHWVADLFLFKFYVGFDPLDKHTNLICGKFSFIFLMP